MHATVLRRLVCACVCASKMWTAGVIYVSVFRGELWLPCGE